MKITLLDGRQYEGVFFWGLPPQEVPREVFCKQLDDGSAPSFVQTQATGS